MARKKIDKTTIEYLSKNLFHKDGLIGFQFTAGRTPRAIDENEECSLSISLRFKEGKGNVVIDGSESVLEEKIMKEFFPNYMRYNRFKISKNALSRLEEIFRKLNYEVDGTNNFAGEWFWFRVFCKNDEIMGHVNILKEALKDFELTPN